MSELKAIKRYTFQIDPLANFYCDLEEDELGRYVEHSDYAALEQERDGYEKALIRLRDCDWVITLPDRMDAVRAIAKQALEGE